MIYMILVINIKYMLTIDMPINMFEKPNFHGSTTVGERGQIVLPAKLREEMNIGAGDKLLVLTGGHPGKGPILIIKADALNDMVRAMSSNFQELIEKTKNE